MAKTERCPYCGFHHPVVSTPSPDTEARAAYYAEVEARHDGRDPRHFIVGFIGGLIVGLLLPIAFLGWTP